MRQAWRALGESGIGVDFSDKVFAYEKDVPNSGGYVLMGDGKTIKKMTAEDFNLAPKLAELPKTAKP